MIEAQKSKFVPLLAPISLAGGATATSLVIDTAGFNYLSVYAFFGLIGANGIATCKFQHSPNSNGSSGADITGASVGALADGDDGECHGGFIDLTGLDRYIIVVLINGATNASVASAFGFLSKANETPNTAAERGLASQFTV